MKVRNVSDLEHRELRSSETGELYSLSAVLTEVAGSNSFKDIFVHHEIIPPGHSSSRIHSHSVREELVLVLSGEVRAVARFPESAHLQTQVMKAGDFVGFQPGVAHTLENLSREPARVLVIASNPDSDRVTYN